MTPASPAPSPDFPDRRLSCALEDPGGAAVVPAAGEDRAPARSMMAPHRPEGGAACPGGGVRCRIRPSAHGVPGGLTVGAASRRRKARGLRIGWPQAARDAGIGRAAGNGRPLPLPGVRVHRPASPALPLPRARVADGREGRCGVRPEPAYSYVGPENAGVGCRTAGWTC